MRSSSQSRTRLSTFARGRAAERRVAWHYRLRGYRILEVKLKEGPRFGDPLEAVDDWKRERLRRGAQAWLLANPSLSDLRVTFEFAAVRPGGIELVSDLLY